MPSVTLRNVKKTYGEVVACDVDYLQVKDKEFLTLLGPSAGGKTTTLRIIAGLIQPDAGEIYIGDRMVRDVPPEKRNIVMVFQNYALFPHMKVFDNVAFGLKIRKLPSDEIKRKVKEALDIVKLEELEDRYPKQLSGGQQQRVALARALVVEPEVLLFDEPLSNLDAKLRESVRFELRALQKKLGITSIYVTHDQAEALVISDKIAVMNEGRIEQIGTPADLYDHPKSKFLADFIGISSFIYGRVVELDDANHAIVKTEDGLQIAGFTKVAKKGDRVLIAIRPQHIEVYEPGGRKGANFFEGVVSNYAYLGDYIDYRIKVGKWMVRTKTVPRKIFKPKEKVQVWFDPERSIVLPVKD